MLASPRWGGQFFCVMKIPSCFWHWFMAIIMKNSMLKSPKF
jgi:hypothetical protein